MGITYCKPTACVRAGTFCLFSPKNWTKTSDLSSMCEMKYEIEGNLCNTVPCETDKNNIKLSHSPTSKQELVLLRARTKTRCSSFDSTPLMVSLWVFPIPYAPLGEPIREHWLKFTTNQQQKLMLAMTLYAFIIKIHQRVTEQYSRPWSEQSTEIIFLLFARTMVMRHQYDATLQPHSTSKV